MATSTSKSSPRQSNYRPDSTGSNRRMSYIPVSTSSRKRPRTTGPVTKYETPYSAANASWTSLNPDLSRSIGTASPPPLVHTKYRLAGGLNTPTRETAEQYENLIGASESDFRRRWTSSTVEGGGRRQTVLVGALQREGNGRRRGQAMVQPSQDSQETWGQFVYNVVGGVAGKVWHFCRSNVFGGFTAGGGPAYELTPTVPKRLRSWDARATPVPGQYHEDDFEELRDSDLERPAKRLQTSQGKDWVLVNPSPHHNSSPQTASYTSSTQRYTPSRAAHARLSAARRSRPSTARLSAVSDVGSPQMESNHTGSASFASPRSQDYSSRKQHYPASVAAAADVQKYTAKRQREERQADASMKKLNHQLKAMIRQGKEALESRVEVQNDGFPSDDAMDEDEDFTDE